MRAYTPLTTAHFDIRCSVFDIRYSIFFISCHLPFAKQPPTLIGTSIKATAHLDIGNSVLDIGYSIFPEMQQGLKADSHLTKYEAHVPLA